MPEIFILFKPPTFVVLKSVLIRNVYTLYLPFWWLLLFAACILRTTSHDKANICASLVQNLAVVVFNLVVESFHANDNTPVHS
jgi:hypothetical protein